MPSEQAEILVRVLAQVDVLFTPYRHGQHGDCHRACAVWERRAEYRRQGVPAIGRGSDTERKRYSRLLTGLQDAGLLTLSGNTRGFRAQLTERGEVLARALVASYDAWQSWPLLRLVDLVTDTYGKASEFYILGKWPPAATGKDAARLEIAMAPLLSRGWIDANSDIKGHVGYSLTSAGRAAMNGPHPETPGDDVPGLEERLSDIYDEEYRTGMSERLSWPPSHPNSLVLPLSCGLWLPPAKRKGLAKVRRETRHLVHGAVSHGTG